MKHTPDHTELSKLLTGILDPQEMNEFLESLLTPQELEELVQRWEIIKLLEAGIPQREISSRLGVAIGTVSRGAREYKYGKQGFRKPLASIKATEL